MNDYQVAVISYRRPDVCAARTLTLLTAGNVNPQLVTVFVSDPAELPTYQQTCGPFGVNVVLGKPGLAANRNYVNSYYPAGQLLLCCDDDLRRLVRLNPAAPPKFLPVTDVDALIRRGFAAAADVGATLWGLYPTVDARVMQHRAASGLRFILGSFHGKVNRPAEKVSCHCKDDYELTLQRWETDGTVLRLDDTAVVTYYAATPGGLQHEGGRTPAKAEQDVAYLERRWPGVVHRNTRRKSDFPEILLRAPRGRL